MLLVMAVTLYTSRIVLRELGITDFGIYTLVGGFISLFAFLNAALSAATQRYLTFSLGKKDFAALQKTFSATLTIHFGIAVLVVLLAETVGLWYLNYKMVIPVERMFAANVVYQFSILATILTIVQVPYNSLLIAHEKMNIYAYVGIAEAILKLLIVFILVLFGSDKLIVYSILTFVVALGIRLFYQFYCRAQYPESHYAFEWDKLFYKELIVYSGWNLFGNLAVVVRSQGSNLLLNLFYGTTSNAAFGIMNTVNGAITNFVSNFQVASNPQIIKLYAVEDYAAMQKLINQTTKFSYYLCLILVAPILLNLDYFLKTWLVNLPEYTVQFVQIILVITLIETLSKAIMTGITATGNIKMYQFVIGFFNLLIVPISYFLLINEVFNSPDTILYIWLFFSVISFVFRLLFVKKLINYNLLYFMKEAIVPIVIVSSISFVIAKLLLQNIIVTSLTMLIVETIVFFVIICVVILIFGVRKSERNLLIAVKEKFKNKFLKR
jgi:O-antigen/teichoic acid export membrane protein